MQYPAMRTLTVARAAFFTFLSPASALNIDHNAQALAAALRGGDGGGVTTTSATVSGHNDQTGFYTEGPLRLEDASILSSGRSASRR